MLSVFNSDVANDRNTNIMSVEDFINSFNFNNFFRKFFEVNNGLVSATYSFNGGYNCNVSVNTDFTGSMKFTQRPSEKKLTICRYDEVRCDKLNIPAVFDKKNPSIISPFDFSKVYVNGNDNKDNNTKPDFFTTVNNPVVAYWQSSFMSYLNIEFQKAVNKAFAKVLPTLLLSRYKVANMVADDICKDFVIKPIESKGDWCLPRNSLIRKVKYAEGKIIPYISIVTEFEIVRNIRAYKEEEI